MMDRSVDSIGSCSLDVDADSSEMSDTSSSLNLLTPLSTTDITLVNPNKSNCEIKTVITQPTTNATEPPLVALGDFTGKKPSYLNLACCVNGYSSITTYDSKIRQDINNSREVSPIRPSSTSIQYCKRNSALVSLAKITMPNINIITPSLCTTPMKGAASEVKYFEANNNYNQSSNGAANEKADEHKKGNSFIQQRVERLYGPGALAQAFYSPKKMKACFGNRLGEATATELSQKFQQLSPSKDCNELSKKVDVTSASSALNSSNSLTTITNDNTENIAIDLPVMRHLSHEFRAQLPSISPKRSILRSHAGKTSSHYSDKNDTNDTPKVGELLHSIRPPGNDDVDHKVPDYNKIDISTSLEQNTHQAITCEKTEPKEVFESLLEENTHNLSENGLGRDGNYFLSLLELEQNRLLTLANKAEKYTDMLSNNPEISEEIFGILRSASGKARLLVSQKMKQFEGLCHNNLNRSPEDNFPTTVEDLQGFWDMVNLQVDNINAIFDDIELLKENGWKKSLDEVGGSSAFKQQKQTKNISPKFKPIKTTVNSNSKTSASTLKREAQRKQLMELKRKHKMALAANSTTPLTESESKNNLELIKENRS